jgi:D-alanyl-lipoteichoic acid acyltransferase DltB (MBOAT superfamily)
LTFLAFSIVAALLYAVWSNATWRQAVMLAANVALIASFTMSPRALLPFACFLALGYVSVWVARFDQGRFSTTLCIAGTLAVFCWLKKYWFLSFAGFLPFAYLTVGLSYAFFRVMGMIVDARTDPTIAAVGPIRYFNFAMNFPTMIAGPIDRYQEFAQPPRSLTASDVAAGMERTTAGFFKVLVLASIVSRWQTDATSHLVSGGAGVHGVWAAAASFGLYPIVLYFNFSGYTDIVIGIGFLFGKRYHENFNAPFSSFNFIDLWSRWHMSLSFWLRDYVHAPFLKLLMQRNQVAWLDPYLGVAAYFLTFFLIGIWHGSTLIFAAYGLLLAFGVSVNKLYRIRAIKLLGKEGYKELSTNVIYRFLCRGLTYTWYSFCLICFWNKGAAALQLLGGLGMAGMAAAFVALLAVVTVALNFFEAGLAAFRVHVSTSLFGDYAPYVRSMILAMLVFGCIANAILTQKINADIIYQAF